MELITWRGTPGVGDFMWALNCAHNYCYSQNKVVTLEFHWEHGADYLHHLEDPETIIERLKYLHNFYYRKDDVTIKHVFNSEGRYSGWKYFDDVVEEEDGSLRVAAIGRKGKTRFWFESGYYSDKEGTPAPDSNWIFRKNTFKQRNKNKVVIWRPTFNAEKPRTWKRELTDNDWETIIRTLSAAGLQVVELTYRTPVSEALYHISTCRMVVCYDGMWHYIARNLCIPMLVVSNEGITKYHTPHCVRAHPDVNKDINVMWWINNLPELLGHTKKKAVDYESKCREFYNDQRSKDRQGSN